MAKSQRKQKKPVEKPAQLFQPKDFLDLIAPAAVKFNTDYTAASWPSGATPPPPRSWPYSPTSVTGPASPSISMPGR